MKKQKEINASLTIRQLFDFSDTGGKKAFRLNSVLFMCKRYKFVFSVWLENIREMST